MKVQLQILFQKMNHKIKKIKNILNKVQLMKRQKKYKRQKIYKRQKKYKLNKKIKKKSSSLLEEYILQNLIALIH